MPDRVFSGGGSAAPGQETSASDVAAVFEAQTGYRYAGSTSDGRAIGVDPFSGDQVAFVWDGSTFLNEKLVRRPSAPKAGPQGPAPPTPSFGVQIGEGGEVFRINNHTGQISPTGQVFPELVADPSISTQVDRNGNLVAIDSKGGTRTLIEGFGFPQQDPAVSTFTDQRTGQTFRVNTQTGEQTPLGTFAYPSIDPERTFAEDVRQFDTSEAGVSERARLAEQGATQRAASAEQGANQRSLLNAGTQGFQSVNQLAPQLGTLALNNAEFTRDVLRNPSDFVARSFFTRGEESPLPQISPADVLNSLRENINRYNETLASFNASAGLGSFNPASSAAPAPPAASTDVAADTPTTPALIPPAVYAKPNFAASPTFSTGTAPPGTDLSNLDALIAQQLAASQGRAAAAKAAPPKAAPAKTTPAATVAPRPSAAPARSSVAATATPAAAATTPAKTFAQPAPYYGYEFGVPAREAPPPPPPPPPPTAARQAGNVARKAVQGQASRIGGNVQTFFVDPFTKSPAVDFARGLFGREEGGMAEGAAVVGEKGPEVVLGDRFMVLNEEQLGMDPMKLKAPRAQAGGVFGPSDIAGFFRAPQLPSFSAVSQPEIQAAEQRARPPAVRDVRAGRTPAPLSFNYVPDFVLPTPQMLGSLTQDEYSAYGSSLAPYNASVGDVEASVRKRFGRPNSGGAATRSFAYSG